MSEDACELVFIRHATRITGQDALSPEGITQARRMGASLGSFSRVISSPARRCIETAEAMGFVPQVLSKPVEADWQALSRLLPEGAGFAAILRVMRRESLGRTFARLLQAQWRSEAELLLPDGRGLVISHGGHIDYIAVACCLTSELTGQQAAAWGSPVGRAEGYSLGYNNGKFRMLRWYRNAGQEPAQDNSDDGV